MSKRNFSALSDKQLETFIEDCENKITKMMCFDVAEIADEAGQAMDELKRRREQNE